MGRERSWSSGGGGHSTKRSKDRAAAAETPPPPAAAAAKDRAAAAETPPPPAAAAAAAAGCMSSVFHLFDFHQFQFSLNHQLCFKPNSSFIQDQDQEHQQQPIVHTTIKGAEAPRNSLESEEDISVTGTDKTVSSSSEIKEEDFGFPIGIRVHTKVSRELSSSESCVSPCIKTPSLVARLMGLDLLPETVLSPSSPSSSSSSSIHSRLNKSTTPDHHHGFESRKPLKTRHTNFMENEIRYEMCGTRSLPDTPRISSARRSDVDPRHSLQINKENQVMINEEFDYGRSSTDSNKSRKREWRLEEDRSSQSPSHYARQIVKQVKESVSRRVGRDITNVVSSNISSSNYNKSNSNSNSSRNNCIVEEEEEAQLLKPKKSSRFNKVAEDLSPSKHSTQSCSPRLRFLETKNKPALPTSQEQISNSPKPLSKPRQVLPSRPPPPPPLPPPQPSKPKVSAKPKSKNIPQHQTIDKCKKASCERFAQRKDTGIIRASPTSKANLNLPADRKCKKSPLSKELSPCSISTPTSVYYSHHHQLLSSSPASKSSSQLSCPSSQTTQYENPPDLDVHNCITTTGTTVEEFRYLSRILKCTGLDTDTQVSFTRWFSPSHPLDPSIFHHLENSFSSSTHTTISGHLTHRSNRKLLFNLVDEILVDILRPYLNMKPWINSIKRKKKKKNNKQMTGDQLLQQLWTEICNFPSANCQILQDIDALIDKDLPDANIRMLPIFEEVESITFEIERDILDSLVHELAATAFFP